MAETRKLAAILAADVAGYSKLAGVDEERTLAKLRALRSDLLDPTIALLGTICLSEDAYRPGCRRDEREVPTVLPALISPRPRRRVYR
jgi:hypothetical protein